MEQNYGENETHMNQYELFWKCENYEAYAIACDIEGLTPIWDKSMFEELKIWIASKVNKCICV